MLGCQAFDEGSRDPVRFAHQAYGPGAHPGTCPLKSLDGDGLVQGTDSVKPPQAAQAIGIVAAFEREGLQQGRDGAIVPFRQQTGTE